MSSLLHCVLYITLVSSALATVTVTNISPMTVEVHQGERHTITAKVEGLPDDLTDVIIVWLVGGTTPVQVVGPNVHGHEDKFGTSFDRATGEISLTINNATSYYTGNVTLQVVVPSRPYVPLMYFSLWVLVPPAGVEMNVNGGAAIEEGKTIEMSCTAFNSTPAVTMKWFHNGAEVEAVATQKDHKTLYTTVSTLSVTPALSNNGDVYKCTVSGKSMTNDISKELTLNVAYLPRVTMSVSPDQSYQIFNSEVTFSCSANANPAEITWQWSIDGEALPGGTSNTYTFGSIAADLNTKELKCVATNSQGSGEAASTLDVYYFPEFTSVPGNIEADLGSNVPLTCTGHGNPAPIITWSKMTRENGWQVVANQENYQIDNLQEADFGKYRCSMHVSAAKLKFDTASSEFYILKNDAPSIDRNTTTSVSYGQGEDAVLTCTATCIPAVSEVLWHKGEDNYVVDTINSARFSMTMETNLDIVEIKLTIKDLASTDFDFYNCTVKNERGSDSAILTLQQNSDFPWKWALGVAAGVIVVGIIIGVAVCMCKRGKNKTSSAGSLSVVSNTTDSSIKKPAEGMEHVDSSSLPEYGMGPIDMWRTNHEPTDSNSFAMDNYSEQHQPELYSSRTLGSSFNPSNAYPPGNYGSYRVQHPPAPSFHTPAVPPYSTLPLRPTKFPPDAYNRTPYVGTDDAFPMPPPPLQAGSRLATNV